MKSMTVKVDCLARVEGEGGLFIKVKRDNVTEVKLNIYEPPRFFEAFLRDRKFTEAPDITARICGICPIAYQTSAAHAMEDICGVQVDRQVRQLRRLIYLGEWIESHALHVYLLHAPDFLGYEDAIQVAKDHPDIVKRGLALKKVGNDVMTLLGGREIHPINMRVGGFYKVPTKRELQAFVEPLTRAAEAAAETVRWVATFNFPNLERDYEFVALRHPDEYAITEGHLVSNKGLDIPIAEFYAHFEEQHVPHSTSLHSVVKTRGEYCVGPMARYNLNFAQLPWEVQALAREVGLGETCNNPFKSIIVRSLETQFACLEALKIIDGYTMPEQPAVEVKPRAGTGHGCSEAPRGSCYHRYKIDEQGIIRDARIAAPTAQNQKVIESDLLQFVGDNLNLSQDDLTWQCEQLIRNYDPCISCSCHFLKLKIERE